MGKKDNEDVTVLQDAWFRMIGTIVIEDDLKKEILTCKKRDKQVQPALEKADPEWGEEAGLVTQKGRVYIPKDKKLHEKIIREHHDYALAGHPGRYKTQELIGQTFWWPRIRTDVIKYVIGCETCQRVNVNQQKKRAPLNPNEIPTKPWEVIQ